MTTAAAADLLVDATVAGERLNAERVTMEYMVGMCQGMSKVEENGIDLLSGCSAPL